MQPKLTDLKMFADIQAQLDAVTSDQLMALPPGEPLKPDVRVIGELTPALKALMCVRVALANQANDYVIELMRKANTMTRAEVAAAREKHQELAVNAEFYNKVFWVALKEEFPVAKDQSCGYGPNFEVYTFEDKDSGDELASVLGSLLMDSLLGDRKRR